MFHNTGKKLGIFWVCYFQDMKGFFFFLSQWGTQATENIYNLKGKNTVFIVEENVFSRLLAIYPLNH